MLGHGSVGADAIGVHEADEFWLGQVARRARLAVRDIRFRWLKYLMQLKCGQRLAAFPAVVDVDVKVVALEDEEAVSVEGFVAVEELDRGRFAFGVVGAAAEEAADDELVNAALVGGERGRGDVVDRVYWRVGLVVIAACSRGLKGAVEKAGVVSLSFWKGV